MSTSGWIDTVLSSFAVGAAATSPVALSMPASERDWFIIGFTFLLAFSGAAAQHRRHTPQKKWTEEKRAEFTQETK